MSASTPSIEYDPRLPRRVVMLVISAAYFAASHWLGRLFGRRPMSSPTVLTYHSVQADEVTRFDRQMKHLRERARVVFADDGSTPGAKPCVAVTFDDALQNVFDRALPVLARHGVPSTIFVPTCYMGLAPGWVDPARNPQRATGNVASEETLRAADPRLVRLGSHTVSHARLNAVNTRQLHEELSASKRTLEDLTGAPVCMLSLPYGSWTQQIDGAARQAGYAHIFTNVPVRHAPRASSAPCGRIDVSPRDWPWEFRLKVQGAYEWLGLAVPVKRKVLRFLGRVQEA